MTRLINLVKGNQQDGDCNVLNRIILKINLRRVREQTGAYQQSEGRMPDFEE